MSKFLKFYLIIILLSCSALADIKEENATKTLNTWKQETKFYIDNFYNLTGTFTQIDYVGNISKGNFWINVFKLSLTNGSKAIRLPINLISVV